MHRNRVDYALTKVCVIAVHMSVNSHVRISMQQVPSSQPHQGADAGFHQQTPEGPTGWDLAHSAHVGMANQPYGMIFGDIWGWFLLQSEGYGQHSELVL